MLDHTEGGLQDTQVEVAVDMRMAVAVDTQGVVAVDTQVVVVVDTQVVAVSHMVEFENQLVEGFLLWVLLEALVVGQLEYQH
mmetsp:Transcript_46470/g.108250  ORF Transcript_46470/g.108250 Transcript_46470/m.108250 type:complete len:82 (-) Transcript_46470:157-402(-)